ncbi:MAG: hypothetical protein CFE46_01480 [Burkholderiales bacterium PBB6]|nr:MAG: hypothetical protein CFE46_01480 [Burkholderiales bacterium PBB6]
MTQVIIIGAGPAGLTAARELQRAGVSQITVLEASADIGGLSKTVNYKGNRIDIGGHRFFSKSDWVMDWWRDSLPIALPEPRVTESEFRLGYQGAHRLLGANEITASESDADVMLVRNRLSRILFGGQFFDYPLKPGFDTARKLGPVKCVKFGASYVASAMSPITPETSLEDFFINRFGKQLYLQFFKEYTEKVWGVPCNEISAAWGAQRVKSLSVTKMIAHAVRKGFKRDAAAEQTSLIEHFLYPKFGPGQMWETVARRYEREGGQLIRDARVTGLHRSDRRITGVSFQRPDGSTQHLQADHVISTMPVKELTLALQPALPAEVTDIGANLLYRDFITVGVLYRKLHPTKASIHPRTHLVPDNWIYIQEPGVKVGRLQIFNNWSPHLVADPNTVWVGLEFFAKDDDDLWAMSDEALKALALKEMQQIGMAHPEDALDATVIRMPKAYPGYFGSAYAEFPKLQAALDDLSNLFLIGRNGMHRYNNQDHSMLSAKAAVDAIVSGRSDKAPIWAINVDDEYHEDEEK